MDMISGFVGATTFLSQGSSAQYPLRMSPDKATADQQRAQAKEDGMKEYRCKDWGGGTIFSDKLPNDSCKRVPRFRLG